MDTLYIGYTLQYIRNKQIYMGYLGYINCDIAQGKSTKNKQILKAGYRLHPRYRTLKMEDDKDNASMGYKINTYYWIHDTWRVEVSGYI